MPLQTMRARVSCVLFGFGAAHTLPVDWELSDAVYNVKLRRARLPRVIRGRDA